MSSKVVVLVTAVPLALLALAVGAVGTASSAGGPEAAKKSGFKPKKVAGIWTGTWNNQTFDTSGSASMSLKVKGKGKKQKIIGVFDLGGNAFGCSEEEINPRKVTMKKGKGENRWNKNGLSADWNNGLGDANLTFTHKGKALTGFGVSPCAADIAYTYTGKFTNKRVTAAVEITLGGEPLAASTLEMSKG